MEKLRPSHPHFPCFFTGWDNTPRRGDKAVVLVGNTPDVVRAGLSRTVESVASKPYQERIIFLNAWNEWAEGMYLEPDQRLERSILDAVRDALSGAE